MHIKEAPELRTNHTPTFIMAQFNKPKKADWGSLCLSNIKEFKINMSLKEIEIMSTN